MDPQSNHADGSPIEVPLVEDNPADVRLIREALKDAKVNSRLRVVNAGAKAPDNPFRHAPYAEALRKAGGHGQLPSRGCSQWMWRRTGRR